MPRRIEGPDGQRYEIPDQATDAQISAFLKAIPVSNAKDVPKARTWTDVAVDALPAAGSIVGGIVGATGGPVTGVAGAGVGGMVGDALKQAANKLRGEAVPGTVPEALGEMAGEAGIGAATAAPFAVGGAAIRAVRPMLGGAGEALASAAGDASVSGSDVLRTILKGDIYKGLKQIVIPPLARTAGKAMQTAGKITPEAAPKIAAETAQSLADDVGLIRESISMGMDPKVAIRIIANGSAEYAEALKDAYVGSVKAAGLPPPAAVMKLLKSPSFQKLGKP